MTKSTFGKTIIRLGTVTSTQDLLRESFHQGVAEGAIAIADEQTLGKGRHGRTWYSTAGKGLWISVLVEPAGPESLWTWTPIWAGIIVRNSILSIVSDNNLKERLLLKWPNDLMVGDFKLGGILTEKVQHKTGRSAVIVGIGVNLKQQPDEFPSYLRKRATSLIQIEDKEFTPDMLLECVINQAEQNLQLLKPIDAQAIQRAWLPHAWGFKEKLQVVSGNKLYQGKFTGLGPNGELVLLDNTGKETLIASSDGIVKENRS